MMMIMMTVITYYYYYIISPCALYPPRRNKSHYHLYFTYFPPATFSLLLCGFPSVVFWGNSPYCNPALFLYTGLLSPAICGCVMKREKIHF